MKYIKKFIVIALCLSFFNLAGCDLGKGEDKPVNMDLHISVDDALTVEKIFEYSGAFVEDGSFEEKVDVAAIKIKNNSDKDIQLARIYAVADGVELFFEVTTLPAGALCTVLEKNAQTIAEGTEFTDFRVENRVDFTAPLTLHDDSFIVQGNDKTINIKNIGETEFTSDIYVYYKNKDADGNYFGGITFRTKADGLKPGEIKQLPASHFLVADSEVLFVDYAG